MNIKGLLASPLKEAEKQLKEHQLNYKLKEIKPPFINKTDLKDSGPKRVLKIAKEDNFYLITWSFQYNS